MTQDNKLKAIESAFAAIEKQFGKGSIMKLSDEKAKCKVEVTSTGSLALDIALGAGGIPKGRIVEVYGTEASGKTTLTLHSIAECQRNGGTAAFIDAEHALDVSYARRIGVNTNELIVSQPDYGEQALEIVDMLVRSGGVDIIVIDSVAALTPKAELEGDMGDSHMGLQARLMSQALRKLTASISRSNCTVVFINQVRMKIGVVFGNPETTTGGQALKFYSSMRLEVRRMAAIKTGGESVGHRTKVKVVKNKIAAPFKEAEFDIMFGKGISLEGDIVDLGTELGIIQKSGTWFTWGKERLGQGRENAKNFLMENPKARATIETEIRKTVNIAGDTEEEDRKGAIAGSKAALPAASSSSTKSSAASTSK